MSKAAALNFDTIILVRENCIQYIATGTQSCWAL
jgi:hypothetical protein